MLRHAGLAIGPLLGGLLFAAVSPADAADVPSSIAVARPMPAVAADAFLARTNAGIAFEIESSRLAVERTSSTAVRAFAEQSIEDRRRAGEKLRATVAALGAKPPSDELDAPHRMTIEDLKSKQAADFDKEYVQAQFNAQVDTLQMFQAYADSGDNDRLKTFAADLLPGLQERLDQVRKLRKP